MVSPVGVDADFGGFISDAVEGLQENVLRIVFKGNEQALTKERDNHDSTKRELGIVTMWADSFFASAPELEQLYTHSEEFLDKIFESLRLVRFEESQTESICGRRNAHEKEFENTIVELSTMASE